MSSDPVNGQSPEKLGLPMVSQSDPEALAAEKAHLAELARKPLFARALGYTKLSGPGWLQSALTLGGGSAGSSLFAGALLGYSLLWVQPVAMLLGIVMMSALAYQTLSTGMRPFHAINHYAHPFFGWSWALASLIASIVWCLPQFNLAGSVIGDALIGVDGDPKKSAMYSMIAAPIILVIAWIVTFNYGKGRRGIRIFETILKILVAGVVLSFAIVVFVKPPNWGEVFQGYFSFYIPRDNQGLDVLISAFATAVGINMTFLFPYTLLARGWGREHRGLVRFDLGTGMLIPFVLATSFVIMASGNLLHDDYLAEVKAAEEKVAAMDLPEAEHDATLGKELGGIKKAYSSPNKLAGPLSSVFGSQLGYAIFGFGIVGMTLSTIVLLMLVSGFIMAEMTNTDPGGLPYKIGICLPGLGVLGPVLWGNLAFYLVVPTSVICFFFLPIAYVTFFIMMNKKAFLGEDRPEGTKRVIWNTLMLLAIVIVAATCAYKIYMALK